MTVTVNDCLRVACAAVGIVYRDVPADGRFHETDVEHDARGRGDGRIKLFPDGQGGIVCNWKGVRRAFFVEDARKLTGSERQECIRKRRDAIRKFQEIECYKHTLAAKKAATIWDAAKPAAGDLPYLTSKGIKANGARQHRGALIIPVCDGVAICSLQFIAANGNKKFLRGGLITGCYFILGEMEGAAALCIAEGFATGATIHEATGKPVAVAFNAGNLEPAARSLRARFPKLTLIVCADDDATTKGNPGRTKATEAACAVGGLLAIPVFGTGRPEGASDFNDLAAHCGKEAVERALAGATTLASVEPQSYPEHAPASTIKSWPAPFARDAYYGLAGEIVRTIEPQSESDPAAILLQVLVSFGALVGRGPHVPIEGDEHHGNLFALIVGETSKARKGTSWGRVREIFSKAAEWVTVVDGLSSGEGLKWAVRDRVTKTDADDKGFAKEVEVDSGVADKRVLIVEPEFSQVLRQASRAGNTLSATIRSSWDSGNLRTLTKNDPVTATGAHICIIGHITSVELRAELTATDSANGFANRFLFMCVKRSKLLAFGGTPLAADTVSDFARRIAVAADKARGIGPIVMTQSARDAWEAVYSRLSEGYPGLYGAVTGRAEAQCLRLALIFALLDEVREIDLVHLLAALAIWERAAASARYIFGDAVGDAVADEILRALRVAGAAGMTRTDISKLLGKHQATERIRSALDLLSRHGLARHETRPTAGAPAEIWISV